jgi:hypothetical protein
LSAFAAAVAGRYVALGSWANVAALPGDEEPVGHDDEIARIIAANPEASLLVVVPTEFQQRVEAASGLTVDARREAVDTVMAQLDVADLDMGDPQIERRLKDCLRRLAYAFLDLQEKARGRNTEARVISGTERDGVYELRSRQVYRR